MFRRIISSLLILMASTAALAAIGPMNYQGRLLNDQGIPVTGSYTFKVRIWNAASGGTLKYAEQHNNVAVNDGVYSFLVSTGTVLSGTWDINLWNEPQMFLEIEVNGETLTPRSRIAAAPYAYQANLALTTNNALALGGKSAEEYGNILQEICESNKGKWLATVERCAGNAADLSGLTWSSLDASNNYSNLDLIKANFSGATFNTVNFSGSLLKQVNLSNANFSNANFSGATIDGATFTGAPNFANANLTNAKIMNMNLAGVNLSTANLTKFSGAKLSGCPTLPASWSCVLQASGTYALIGSNANYSNTSAGLIPRYGAENFLDINNLGSVTNLANSNFNGVYSNLFFGYLSLDSATFDYAQLMGATYQTANLGNTSFNHSVMNWMTFNQSDMNATQLDNAFISNSTFEWNGMLNTSFYGSSISSTSFDYINNGSTYHDGVDPNIDFRYVSMRDVEFDLSDLSLSDFSDAYLTNVYFYSTVLDYNGLVSFVDARLDDVWFIGSIDPIWADFTDAGLYNVDFSSEDFSYSYFDSAYIYNNDFSNATLNYASFDNATLEYTSFNNADLTDATFSGATFLSVTWTGATCPNGTLAAGANGCQDQM